jgi:hypothetical protein
MIVWGGQDDAEVSSSGGRYGLGLSQDGDGDGFEDCGGDCDDGDDATFPGASQECDGRNNDCDHPSWPGLAGTNEDDGDGDGLSECAGDCDDVDGEAWDTPGEVTGLQLAGSTMLAWTAPGAGGLPGGMRYDVARGTDPGDLTVAATCVATGVGPATSGAAPQTPAVGQLFVYLVRARNACPGNGSWGSGTGGAPRTVPPCGETAPAPADGDPR